MGHRYYSVPSHMDWTDRQRHSYIFGRHQDAHIRRWYAEQALRASAHITTESLLATLRGR